MGQLTDLRFASDFVVPHGEFLPELHVRHDNRLRIQPAEDGSALVIAALDQKPQPLGLAGAIVNDLELHMVAFRV